MDDSIFDRILKKEIPCTEVYEDEFSFAFKDIAPCAPDHVIVIPKKKVVCISEWIKKDPLEIGQFMHSVTKVTEHLELSRHGFRLVINEGKQGGQTVPYLHVHILGGRDLHWPPG